MASKARHFPVGRPLLLEQQLSDDERAVRDAARDYCQGRLAPRIPKPSATRRPTRPSSARWASSACSARRSEAYGGAG